MPIYEYRCPKGHLFELFQRMDDPAARACEVCGATPLEKVFHPVPIFFKGKGFYSTDYGRGGRNAIRRDSSAPKPAATAPKAEKKDSPKKAAASL